MRITETQGPRKPPLRPASFFELMFDEVSGIHNPGLPDVVKYM